MGGQKSRVLKCFPTAVMLLICPWPFVQMHHKSLSMVLNSAIPVSIHLTTNSYNSIEGFLEYRHALNI